jgi:outer membrane autotransporter protein
MTKLSRFSYLLCALSLWTPNAWSFWPFSESAPPPPGPTLEEPPKETLTVNIVDPSSKDPKDPSPERCDFATDYAVADWLNCINIGSFLNSSSKYILNHDQCFVCFNACGDISLWAEPYGFYSHYRAPLKEGKMNITLASFGSDVAAQFSITDEIKVGAGAGYFHSSLHDKENGKNAKINAVYFGPAVEYLFSEASVALTLFAVKNFYDGPKETSDGSWDLNMRLEGEYDYALPADCCIQEMLIHPFARIDYLFVFEEGEKEHSSFFYSKLGSRFDKVVYSGRSGVVTAGINLGWINMTPVSGGCNGRPNSKNQLGVGLAVVGMHTDDLLVSLEYDAAIGSNAPMQTGRVRVEWNW